MFELIKLVSELLVLRDAKTRGTFSWLTMAVGVGAVLVVGAVGAIVIRYLDTHPGPAGNRLIVGFLIFAAVVIFGTVAWGWRYQNALAARRSAQSNT